MRTIGPVNLAIGPGRVFEYFDELRKILELASQDVFFVDPYLNAEFVSRYLTIIRNGVNIRLLTKSDQRQTTALRPAVELFARENNQTVQVRTTEGLHDRYLFIDQTSCFHSGSSFKDGAKKAGTIISQITDGFQPMWKTYDDLWSAAKIEL